MSINYEVLEGNTAYLDGLKIDQLLGWDTTKSCMIYYDQFTALKHIVSADTDNNVTNSGGLKTIPMKDDGWVGISSSKPRITFEDDSPTTLSIRDADLILRGSKKIYFDTSGIYTDAMRIYGDTATKTLYFATGASDSCAFSFGANRGLAYFARGSNTSFTYYTATDVSTDLNIKNIYKAICNNEALFSATDEYVENQYWFNWYDGEGSYAEKQAGYVKVGKALTWDATNKDAYMEYGVNDGYDNQEVSFRIETPGYLVCKSRHEIYGNTATAANDLILGKGNYFMVTGSTQINRIAAEGWQVGSIITLRFADSVTVKNGQTAGSGYYGFKLSGAADFSATQYDTLTLAYDQLGWWIEICRSVN